MLINTANQLLNHFRTIISYKRFNLSDVFYDIFKAEEFNDEIDQQFLITYLALRLHYLESRIEKLERGFYVKSD